MSKRHLRELNRVASEILAKLTCGDPHCVCHKNAGKDAGTTHCPVCGRLTLHVGHQLRQADFTSTCPCSRRAIIDELRRQLIDVSEIPMETS